MNSRTMMVSTKESTLKSLWAQFSGTSSSSETSNLLPTTSSNLNTASYGTDENTNLKPPPEHSCSGSMCTADSSESSSYELPSPSQQSPSRNITNPRDKPKRPALSTLQLATIIFYSVSGGPFGVEESIRAAGPFYTLLGFCIAPIIFSLPECLMTVELASGGFQSSAAGCAWVEEAFGRNIGFLSGFLQWVSGATDNAIYPVLFLECALQVFPNDQMEDLHSITRLMLITGIAVGLAYVNWLGLDLVGNMSMLVGCIAMSPFVLLVIFGASKVDPE